MSEWRKALEAKFPYEVATCGPACVYCGNDAKGGRDHVPPLCVVSRFPEDFLRVLYPACARCNLALMDYPEACLFLRAEVITQRLIKAAHRAFDRDVGHFPQPALEAAEAVYAICDVIHLRAAEGVLVRLCACASCRPWSGSCRPPSWSLVPECDDFNARRDFWQLDKSAPLPDLRGSADA